jgi:hypothetical protein
MTNNQHRKSCHSNHWVGRFTKSARSFKLLFISDAATDALAWNFGESEKADGMAGDTNIISSKSSGQVARPSSPLGSWGKQPVDQNVRQPISRN